MRLTHRGMRLWIVLMRPFSSCVQFNPVSKCKHTSVLVFAWSRKLCCAFSIKHPAHLPVDALFCLWFSVHIRGSCGTLGCFHSILYTSSIKVIVWAWWTAGCASRCRFTYKALYKNVVSTVSNKATKDLSSGKNLFRMVQLFFCFLKWHRVKFFPQAPALPCSNECQWMKSVPGDANCTPTHIHTKKHKHTHTHTLTNWQGYCHIQRQGCSKSILKTT